MFAYCGNSPINYVDHGGTAAVSIKDSTIPSTTTLLMRFGAIAIGMGAVISISKASNSTKKVALPVTASIVSSNFKKQAYFTSNPYDFNPKGLRRFVYPGTKNGKIIKWINISSNTTVFEWDEDFTYGPHYHIRVAGYNVLEHIPPDTPVPEPFNTIYF